MQNINKHLTFKLSKTRTFQGYQKLTNKNLSERSYSEIYMHLYYNPQNFIPKISLLELVSYMILVVNKQLVT